MTPVPFLGICAAVDMQELMGALGVEDPLGLRESASCVLPNFNTLAFKFLQTHCMNSWPNTFGSCIASINQGTRRWSVLSQISITNISSTAGVRRLRHSFGTISMTALPNKKQPIDWTSKQRRRRANGRLAISDLHCLLPKPPPIIGFSMSLHHIDRGGWCKKPSPPFIIKGGGEHPFQQTCFYP